MDLKMLSRENLVIFSFFALYLYELEKNKEISDILSSVIFHSDEANTDKDLKVAVKNYMISHPYIETQNDTVFFLDLDEISIRFDLTEIIECSINNVFLPEELTEEHKTKIRQSKTSVYTNPDLYVEILGSNNAIEYISLELKSTKQDKIPGSSAQQAHPYEWTLFVKHNANNIDVVTGLYANTVTGKLPFPDRSPRPQVSFSQLKNWNYTNRKYDENGFRLTLNTKELNEKALVISDWEHSLVKDWMIYIKSDKKPNKWFDHTQRMFVKDLLEYYESLSDIEKQIFIAKNLKHL